MPFHLKQQTHTHSVSRQGSVPAQECGGMISCGGVGGETRAVTARHLKTLHPASSCSPPFSSAFSSVFLVIFLYFTSLLNTSTFALVPGTDGSTIYLFSPPSEDHFPSHRSKQFAIPLKFLGSYSSRCQMLQLRDLRARLIDVIFLMINFFKTKKSLFSPVIAVLRFHIQDEQVLAMIFLMEVNLFIQLKWQLMKHSVLCCNILGRKNPVREKLQMISKDLFTASNLLLK